MFTLAFVDVVQFTAASLWRFLYDRRRRPTTLHQRPVTDKTCWLWHGRGQPRVHWSVTLWDLYYSDIAERTRNDGRTRLSTVGDRAFPVTAARIWNSLPQHVTSAPSLLVFRSRLKSHPFYYFPTPVAYYAQWLRSGSCHFGQFNNVHVTYLLTSSFSESGVWGFLKAFRHIKCQWQYQNIAAVIIINIKVNNKYFKSWPIELLLAHCFLPYSCSIWSDRK